MRVFGFSVRASFFDFFLSAPGGRRRGISGGNRLGCPQKRRSVPDAGRSASDGVLPLCRLGQGRHLLGRYGLLLQQLHRLQAEVATVDRPLFVLGYDKRSQDPEHPGFRPGALALYAWLAGRATNAMKQLGAPLGAAFLHAHKRTLRRYLLCLPAQLYLLGPDRLLVALQPKRLRPVWEALLRRLNRDPVRIPWLHNHKLVFSLDAPPTPSTQPRSAQRYAPSRRGGDVWC